MYMTNNDLWAVMKLKYPDLEGGRDYLMACKIPNEGFEQQEHAYIFRWNVATVAEPSQADLEAYWTANMSAVLAAQIAEAFRVERDRRLIEADALVETAIDKGDAQAERAARDYRQALRDVPQQPDFPETVDWPLLPQ
ncbi:phage tail assembly chaperone [Burkholderia sp. S171]|uniref:XkdW family protein n=1 Tax=Burkholderia sp. S171 TaxID=1641860 RepID=UPI00131C9351|nr:phage tail assembly chaperone [Burkholderia sp. S171]